MGKWARPVVFPTLSAESLACTKLVAMHAIREMDFAFLHTGRADETQLILVAPTVERGWEWNVFRADVESFVFGERSVNVLTVHLVFAASSEFVETLMFQHATLVFVLGALNPPTRGPKSSATCVMVADAAATPETHEKFSKRFYSHVVVDAESTLGLKEAPVSVLMPTIIESGDDFTFECKSEFVDGKTGRVSGSRRPSDFKSAAMVRVVHPPGSAKSTTDRIACVIEDLEQAGAGEGAVFDEDDSVEMQLRYVWVLIDELDTRPRHAEVESVRGTVLGNTV